VHRTQIRALPYSGPLVISGPSELWQRAVYSGVAPTDAPQYVGLLRDTLDIAFLCIVGLLVSYAVCPSYI
jgi:hypothetical protein